ncbi:hypothetical protein A6S26_04125 [Nostoc sp. ATCC 43529]|nr:hypothetical protein A6S26_04125 [Nostoc sp. ATCC 43529]
MNYQRLIGQLCKLFQELVKQLAVLRAWGKQEVWEGWEDREDREEIFPPFLPTLPTLPHPPISRMPTLFILG